MTRQQLEALGRQNALEAVDQAGSYRDVSDAIDNYFENLGDTLTELGVNGEDRRFAAYGFEAALNDKGISHPLFSA